MWTGELRGDARQWPSQAVVWTGRVTCRREGLCGGAQEAGVLRLPGEPGAVDRPRDLPEPRRPPVLHRALCVREPGEVQAAGELPIWAYPTEPARNPPGCGTLAPEPVADCLGHLTSESRFPGEMA